MIKRHATIAGLGTTIRVAISLLLNAARHLIQSPLDKVQIPRGLNLPVYNEKRAARAETWLKTLAALLAGKYELSPPRPRLGPSLPAVKSDNPRPCRPRPERAMRHAFRYQKTGELVVSLTRDLGLHPAAQEIPSILYGIPETPYELSLLVNPDEPTEILFPHHDFSNPIPVERPKSERAPAPEPEPVPPDTG